MIMDMLLEKYRRVKLAAVKEMFRCINFENKIFGCIQGAK
jgi:hypothetical protein